MLVTQQLLRINCSTAHCALTVYDICELSYIIQYTTHTDQDYAGVCGFSNNAMRDNISATYVP